MTRRQVALRVDEVSRETLGVAAGDTLLEVLHDQLRIAGRAIRLR